MDAFILILIFVSGLVVGITLMNLVFAMYYNPIGTLKIDTTDLEKDIYRIEIDDFDKMEQKNLIVLKVDNKANLTSK